MRVRKKEESTDKSREDQDYSVPCPWLEEDPPRKRLLLAEGDSPALSVLRHCPCSWVDHRSPNGMLVPVKFLESSLSKTSWCRGQKTFFVSFPFCFHAGWFRIQLLVHKRVEGDTRIHTTPCPKHKGVPRLMGRHLAVRAAGVV